MTSAASPLARLRALYVSVLGLLVLCCLAWFSLDRLKYSVAQYSQNRGSSSGLPAFILSLLEWPDYLLVITVLACFGLMMYWEIRRRELSIALLSLPPKHLNVFLIALFIWFAHSYLYAGYLLAGDAGSHIARTAHLRMGLKSGTLLFWDNYFYTGDTLLQFTGPLYFWLTALVDYAITDANLSTKLVVFALHLAAGLALYKLLLEYGLRRFAALIGAVAYSGSFAHLHLMMWESAFPQAISFLALPLAVWMIERILRDTRHLSRWWLVLTLADAALLINHQATGVFIGIFIALYVLASLALRRASWTRLFPIVTSAVVSVLMSLFALIPILAEKSGVMLYDEPELLIHGVWPGVAYFLRLIIWSNTDARGSPATYIGVSVVVLALLGLYYALRGHTDRPLKPLVGVLFIGLVLSFFLRGSHARHMIVTLFFFSMLAGIGVHILLAKIAKDSRLPAIVILVLMLDLGTTAVQPLARTDKGYFAQGGDYLATQAANERILLTRSYQGILSASIGPGGPPLFYYPVQSLVGAHNLAATLTHNYVAAVIKMAERDLQETKSLASATESLLEMLNVSRLINDNRTSLGLPEGISGAVDESPLGRVLRLPYSTPMVFSTRLEEVVPAKGMDKPVLWNEDFIRPYRSGAVAQLIGFVDKILEQMNYDRKKHSAAVLVIRPDNANPSYIPPGETKTAAEWNGRLEKYTVSFDKIELSVFSELAGYLQVSHPWYTTMRVRQNGQTIAPFRGATNFMVLPIAAGSNRYEIDYPLSRLRVLTGWFSGGIFVFTILLLVARNSRQRALSKE